MSEWILKHIQKKLTQEKAHYWAKPITKTAAGYDYFWTRRTQSGYFHRIVKYFRWSCKSRKKYLGKVVNKWYVRINFSAFIGLFYGRSEAKLGGRWAHRPRAHCSRTSHVVLSFQVKKLKIHYKLYCKVFKILYFKTFLFLKSIWFDRWNFWA